MTTLARNKETCKEWMKMYWLEFVRIKNLAENDRKGRPTDASKAGNPHHQKFRIIEEKEEVITVSICLVIFLY